MTCSRSGLVAQNTNFVSPCVGPFPLLGLMLRGDNLGISKQYIYIVARINLRSPTNKKGPCSSIGRAMMI